MRSLSTNRRERQIQQPQYRRAATVAYLLCVICFFCYGRASATFSEPPGLPGPAGMQNSLFNEFDDPPDYQPMTFDLKHRSGYNTSKCTDDLFNCWEIISPEAFCYYYNQVNSYQATTMCDRMRIYCSDEGYDQDDYKYIFEAREAECHPGIDSQTRRRSGPGDRMYVMPWSMSPPRPDQLEALRRRLRGDYSLPLSFRLFQTHTQLGT